MITRRALVYRPNRRAMKLNKFDEKKTFDVDADKRNFQEKAKHHMKTF